MVSLPAVDTESEAAGGTLSHVGLPEVEAEVSYHEAGAAGLTCP